MKQFRGFLRQHWMVTHLIGAMLCFAGPLWGSEGPGGPGGAAGQMGQTMDSDRRARDFDLRDLEEIRQDERKARRRHAQREWDELSPEEKARRLREHARDLRSKASDLKEEAEKLRKKAERRRSWAKSARERGDHVEAGRHEESAKNFDAQAQPLEKEVKAIEADAENCKTEARQIEQEAKASQEIEESIDQAEAKHEADAKAGKKDGAAVKP